MHTSFAVLLHTLNALVIAGHVPPQPALRTLHAAALATIVFPVQFVCQKSSAASSGHAHTQTLLTHMSLLLHTLNAFGAKGHVPPQPSDLITLHGAPLATTALPVQFVVHVQTPLVHTLFPVLLHTLNAIVVAGHVPPQPSALRPPHAAPLATMMFSVQVVWQHVLPAGLQVNPAAQVPLHGSATAILDCRTRGTSW